MATIRLIPSGFTVSNTNYVSVAEASAMYQNTDDTYDFATLQGRTRNSSTAYYAFIGGFNFNDVPADAVVSDFKVKIKAGRNSYQRTGTNFYLRLTYGSTSGTVISGTTLTSNLGTTEDVFTFPNGSLEWSDLVNYGNNFSIEVPLAGNSGSNPPHVYVYGAEIEVTYTLSIQHSVTLTNTTEVTASVSDTSPYEGEDVYVNVSAINDIIVTDNNTDVTNQFVQATGGTINAVAESQTNAGISSGSSYAAYAVGRSAEDPYRSTSNMYSSSGSTGHVDYVFDFSSIPGGVTISSVSVVAYGHAESATYTSGSRMAEIQLYSGATAKGSAVHYTSTSNSNLTVSNPGTWTRDELQHAILRFTVANYGGLICGITWSVTYTSSGYTYTISNIVTDHAIVISPATLPLPLRVKQNGSWVTPTKIFVKQNGTWEQATKILAKNNGTWK